MLSPPLVIALAIAANPGSAPSDGSAHSPEFHRAEDLFRRGYYDEAATLFLRITAQHPDRPEADEAQRLALEAARRSPRADRPPSPAGRIELTVDFALGGAAIGLVGTSLASSGSCCGPDLPLPAAAIVPIASGGLAGALTWVLTPPDLPPYRPQLAATVAVWGTFVPLMGLGIASGGFGARSGSSFTVPIELILFGAPIVGGLGGLALGKAVEVDPGRLSLLNSGAFYGFASALLVVGGLAGLAPGEWPWVGLAGALGGAIVAVPFALLTHPKRRDVLLVDATTVVGGLAALGLSAAVPRFATSSPTTALVVACGAVIGLSAGVATNALAPISAGANASPAAVMPWTTGRSTGLAAAFRF